MTKNCSIQIKPLTKGNYASWLRLWQNYLTFYETALSAHITENTWQKLHDNEVPIHGFGAWIDDQLLGIVHVMVHPTTWSETESCYLHDLYVDKGVRGQGVGRALIEEVYSFARTKDCNRVYWTTQEGNTASRLLYDQLAIKTDMVQYRKNL
ncbi:N-acetyltransferase family protein [Psychrobacter sp. DM4]|uniref:GNAT family N-acetyltransferase n=1 Tax=Psychrobacter sp. DM4 TaxID=3440637 RepID=UPI003F50C565